MVEETAVMLLLLLNWVFRCHWVKKDSNYLPLPPIFSALSFSSSFGQLTTEQSQQDQNFSLEHQHFSWDRLAQ